MGIISTTLIERYKTEATHKRDKEARFEARQDKAREQHAEFQRQTLTDLQDAFLNLIHSAGAMHTNNSNIFGDGDWKDGAVYRPVELSAKYDDAQAKTILLIGRLADEAARELATKTKVDCTLAYTEKSKRDADEAMGHALQSFMQVNARISKLLRELNQFPELPST